MLLTPFCQWCWEVVRRADRLFDIIQSQTPKNAAHDRRCAGTKIGSDDPEPSIATLQAHRTRIEGEPGLG